MLRTRSVGLLVCLLSAAAFGCSSDAGSAGALGNAGQAGVGGNDSDAGSASGGQGGSGAGEPGGAGGSASAPGGAGGSAGAPGGAGGSAGAETGGTGGGDAGTGCDCVHGRCVTEVDVSGAELTHCVCEPSWAGATCSECSEGYAGADCSSCAPGYVGSSADPDGCYPDPCSADPCNGHGTCRTVVDPTGVDAAACVCDPAFTGDQCDSCAPGYYGANCESCASGYVQKGSECVEAACADIPCGPHGRCLDRDGNGTGECICEGGYSGRSCEDCAPGYTAAGSECIADLCANVDCGPGSCTAVTGVPACLCPRGYTGSACEQCDTGFVPVTANGATTCQNVLPITDQRLTASYDAAAVWSVDRVGDRVTGWTQTDGDGRFYLLDTQSTFRPRYLLLPPAIEFVGGQFLWTNTHTLRDGDTYTIVVVAGWNPSGGRQTILDSTYSSSTAGEAYSLVAVGANEVQFSHRTIGSPKADLVSSTDFDASAGRQLIVVRRGPFGLGTALSISNGDKATTIVASNGPLSEAPFGMLGHCLDTQAAVKCTDDLDGRIHELLFYDGSLSLAEVGSIEDYLRVKWGL